MFLVNSRLGLFTAAYLRRLPFSRSYGVILQSSLTRVLPFVLQFSCRLPVSVCGTGAFMLFSDFSRQREFIYFVTYFHSSSSPNLLASVLHYLQVSWFERNYPSSRLDYPSVSSHHLFVAYRRYRNIYLLSISYAVRPRLSSRLNLGGRTFPRKPKTFDDVVSHYIRATYAGILSCVSSTAASATASASTHCSSTNTLFVFLNFGV